MGINLKLSKKKKPGTELQEILLRFTNSYQHYNYQAKSGIFVTEDNFKNGAIKVNYRKLGNDVAYHEEMEERMNKLKSFILQASMETGTVVTKDWLVATIERFHKQLQKGAIKTDEKPKKNKKSIYELFEEYLSVKPFSLSHTKNNKVLIRDIGRFEGFIRATQPNRKLYKFDVDEVTRADIEEFRQYLKMESELESQYPKIFEELLKVHPVSTCRVVRKLKPRGNNTIVKLMKYLKTFFGWLNEAGYTKNHPFDGVKIGSEVYGPVYALTQEERDYLLDFDFSDDKALEVQRDIFVFQCMIGCRVGDLYRFTEKNIYDGILFYTPGKTLENPTNSQAHVPLMPKALALIEKYRGVDPEGRLFPFIASQNYNYAIKDILTKAGINRNVEILNSTTGQLEMRAINEIISSHTGRRTFISNAYKHVQDPKLIGKMSGHTDGSRAFERYRHIDDDTLRGIIDKMK